jgi:7,8-dihydropterin-6-yl-methyl-4-(beta-D-ribofuranosyl)aminobenzene 5'-phosphate synthase
MRFRITTLVDNSVSLSASGLIGEHGLSYLIESQDHTILFDTGQQVALSHNAAKLNIDLRRIDAVVLSHGHYDHTGGLNHLLEMNTSFSLYAHPDVFATKLRSVEKEKYKKIGIPIKRAALENTDVQLVLTDSTCEIAPGISTSGEIPLENDFESIEPDFFIEQEGRIMPDTLADDQALILDTQNGLVVLLGCSHRGVINTLNQVVKLTGKHNIHAMIGGLHLGKASDAKLNKIMDHLAGFSLEKIGVSHCTGTKAMLTLFNTFKDSVFVNTVGSVISF